MAIAPTEAPASLLVLRAVRAVDLMTPNPTSLRAEASVREAISWLTEKGFNAAPVIDESGRPVGVVSRSDVLVHERERLQSHTASTLDSTTVRDIMTPAVFSVTPHVSAAHVVEQFLTLNVHQLFVVDEHQALIGVISSHDVLRHLRPSD